MATIWRFLLLVYLVQSFGALYGKYVDFTHHDYQQMTDVLKDLNEAYPKISRLYSLGETHQKRKLWVMEISDNPGVHEPGEPEFKYIGNMHGNEVVSREILLHLIEHMLQGYNGQDSSITWLVNNSRIHIMPSMNPDGYEIAKTQPSCYGVRGRKNSLSVDLNRDFPDQFAPNKRDDSNVQVETRLVMNWIRQNPFVLSANFHGGALVANYPFDDTPDQKSKYSASPDDDVFRKLALTYSKNHKKMFLSGPCPGDRDRFKDGITNGAQWYSVTGGMQDYNYVNSNCFEITVEVSCCKFPSQSKLEGFWDDNKDALLAYLQSGHTGLKGFVKDQAGNGISGAQIEVLDRKHPIKSAKDGDYWRLLLPGTYHVRVSKYGFYPVERSFDVAGGPATVENFTLHHDGDLSFDDRHQKEGSQLLEDKKKGEEQALSVPLVVGLTVICIISLLLALGLAVMMVKRYREGSNKDAGYSKIITGP